MGIDLNLAVLLAQMTTRYALRGDVLTLGEQTIGFDAAALTRAIGLDFPERELLRQGAFFSALGFTRSESVDLHASEDADHLLDLNVADTPDTLAGRFDVVINGGTLEHIFHLPHALAHITRMLKPGGVAIHITPCNNWVDHGFYQISPTLLFDYSRAAGYEPLESIAALRVSPQRWEIHALVEGGVDGQREMLARGPVLHVFAARRGVNAQPHATPQQRIYSSFPNITAHTRWFPAYELTDGVHIEPRVLERRLLNGAIVRGEGRAWVAALVDLASFADTMSAPSRSTLAVYEDGEPIGPPHCAHADIQALGAGRYSHWNESLVFSTRDGSVPTENGRHYEAVLFAAPGKRP